MVPEVYTALKARKAEQNYPATGWVFPTGSASGHIEECSATFYHNESLQKFTAASAAYGAWEKGGSNGDWIDVVSEGCKLEPEYLRKHGTVIQMGCKRFEIYCLRHSALTMLAESGCDAFTLARIAGHSSITITQRYCHPQADAIERAFGNLSGGHKIGHTPAVLRSASRRQRKSLREFFRWTQDCVHSGIAYKNRKQAVGGQVSVTNLL